MWKQDVTPNLDPIVYDGGKMLLDWYGMCLATVETAFGSPRLYPNAWVAYNATQFRHEDTDFPANVYFPIWFSGYSGLGHVAIAYVNAAGVMNIWTSPFKHVPYFYTGYDSVDRLATGYGVTYVGWSEDIAGLRVIDYQADTPPAPSHPYTVENITPKQMSSDQLRTKWNLDATKWSDFTGVSQLAPNTPVTITGIATHNLGGTYYMEDVNVALGFNTADLADYVPPVATQPSNPPENPVDTGVNTPPSVIAPPEPDPTPVEPPVIAPPIAPEAPAQTEPPLTPPVKVIVPEPHTHYSLWQLIVAVLKKLFGVK